MSKLSVEICPKSGFELISNINIKKIAKSKKFVFFLSPLPSNSYIIIIDLQLYKHCEIKILYQNII